MLCNPDEPNCCAAACMLQRVWRRKFRLRTVSHVVETYFAKGPTIERVKAMRYSALSSFLREKPIMGVMAATVQRVYKMSAFRHGLPPRKIPLGAFLAGYMVAYFSESIFDNVGELERNLIQVAEPLLVAFEGICNNVRAGRSFHDVPLEASQAFLLMLEAYLERFEAWRVVDKERVTVGFKRSLRMLYHMRQGLVADKTALGTQIESLRAGFQQVVGAQGLAEFDRAFLEEEGFVPEAGPPLTAVRFTTGLVPLDAKFWRVNVEQLVHELLVDRGFRMTERGMQDPENPLYKRTRSMFPRGFWPELARDVRAGRLERVLSVLAQCRDDLMELAAVSRAAGDTSRVIDMDRIRAAMRFYTWDDVVQLVEGIMAAAVRMQPPSTDQSAWQALRSKMLACEQGQQGSVFCAALEFVFGRLGVIRMEICNASLPLVVEYVRRKGIEGERSRFQERLRDGSVTLDRTRAWIRRSMGTADDEFASMHQSALLGFVVGDDPVADLPETLLLDAYRLRLLRKEFRYQAAAAAMLVGVHHGAGGREEVMTAIVSDAFAGEEEMDVEQCIAAIEAVLLKTGVDEAPRRVILCAVRQYAEPDNAVHALMVRRLRAFWFNVMSLRPGSQSAFQHARGLIPRMERAANLLRSISAVNRAVHASVYGALMAEMPIV